MRLVASPLVMGVLIAAALLLVGLYASRALLHSADEHTHPDSEGDNGGPDPA